MMRNTGLMSFGILGAILLGFIPPLIVWLNRGKLTPTESSIITTLLNFEISYFIFCIVVCCIPIIGKMLLIIMGILYIIYIIKAFLAFTYNKQLEPLTIYEFIK